MSVGLAFSCLLLAHGAAQGNIDGPSCTLEYEEPLSLLQVTSVLSHKSNRSQSRSNDTVTALEHAEIALHEMELALLEKTEELDDDHHARTYFWEIAIIVCGGIFCCSIFLVATAKPQEFEYMDPSLPRIPRSMVSSANDLPGHTIVQTLGVVRGLSVKSRSIAGNFGAIIQTCAGGDITLLSEMCEHTREQAFDSLLAQAAAVGADGLVAFRFDNASPSKDVMEVLAYGTAVKVEKAESAETDENGKESDKDKDEKEVPEAAKDEKVPETD